MKWEIYEKERATGKERVLRFADRQEVAARGVVMRRQALADRGQLDLYDVGMRRAGGTENAADEQGDTAPARMAGGQHAQGAAAPGTHAAADGRGDEHEQEHIPGPAAGPRAHEPVRGVAAGSGAEARGAAGRSSGSRKRKQTTFPIDGGKLKAAIYNLGYSQREVCLKMGYNQNAISNAIANGAVSFPMAVSLEHVLGIKREEYEVQTNVLPMDQEKPPHNPFPDCDMDTLLCLLDETVKEIMRRKEALRL